MNEHYCNASCKRECIGTEVEPQWTFYPGFPMWRLERVFRAHKNVDGNRETEEARFPVIVERLRV